MISKDTSAFVLAKSYSTIVRFFFRIKRDFVCILDRTFQIKRQFCGIC